MRVHTSRFMCSAATTVASALTAVIKPLGAGYAITCAIALLAQRKLQYFPSAVRPSHPGSVNTLFADIQEVEFVSADGTRCQGWHWPAPTAAKPVLPWWLPDDGALPRLAGVVAELPRTRLQQTDVVLFHGNAGDRSHRLGWMHLVRECLGCSVTVRRMHTLTRTHTHTHMHVHTHTHVHMLMLMHMLMHVHMLMRMRGTQVLDYRGYGGSEGSPTEAGFYQDGAAAVAWVKERQQAAAAAAGAQGPPRRRLVLWGESIGTGVALSQAAEADAVVIEGGFSSAVDLGAAAYPWLPVRWFMLDKFLNTRWAERLPREMPVLMVHGALDDIAPLRLSRKLFAALPERRRRFVEFARAGHNDLPYHDPAEYVRAVGSFLGELGEEV